MPILTKSSFSAKSGASVPLDFKADGAGRIAGYGSIFGNIDSYGEKVAPGAFAKSLAEMAGRGAVPKMLWQHNPDKPIGRWLVAREDSRGLYVEGQLNLKTTGGRDAYEHLAAGDVDGMSIGYREVKVRPDDGNGRILEELALVEVSVVTFQANRLATVETVKGIESKSDLVDLLRGAGLAKTAAVRIAAGGWPALAGADAENQHQKAIDLAAEIERATQQLKSADANQHRGNPIGAFTWK